MVFQIIIIAARPVVLRACAHHALTYRNSVKIPSKSKKGVIPHLFNHLFIVLREK